MHPWPGTYLFQLIVNDGLQDSQPDVVKIVIGPNHAPVADAGPWRYLAVGSVTLDGTKSYDPDGGGMLTYQWRQVSGPAVTLTGTNTSMPVVSVTPKTTVQKCVFELIVSDGNLISSPSNVTVTIVPNYFTSALVLNNPPFDSAKPTVLAFSGGNCSTGSGLTLGGIWEQQANWLTVNTYGPAYAKYGDMLMVYLSSVAPDYKKPIQTMGYSTGNLPAMEVARPGEVLAEQDRADRIAPAIPDQAAVRLVREYRLSDGPDDPREGQTAEDHKEYREENGRTQVLHHQASLSATSRRSMIQTAGNGAITPPTP
jgi:hypothetical protein